MNEFKEKNKGLEFRINKAKHMIPSKEFPLSTKDKKKMEMYTWEDTEPVTDKKVIEIFNSYKFRTGRCFYNAFDLLQLLKSEGIEGWQYYSGWFFLPNNYPVFHAWLVNGRQVLDYSNDMGSILKEKIGKFESNDEAREHIVIESVKRDAQPSSENKVCGQLHIGMVFFGSPDTFENALDIKTSLVDNHVTYRKDGMNQYGDSKANTMIKKIKGEHINYGEKK